MTATTPRYAGLDRRMLFGLAGAAAAAPVIASARAEAPKPLWSANYVAKKGALSLALYRRRAKPPGGAKDRAPVLLLAHGSSFGALTSYDLHVPGGGEYSMMNVFARQGFDVWALDFEGYGRSGSSGGASNMEDSVADLRAAVDVIARETGEQAYHLYGQSSGALRVGLFATLEPSRVRHVMLEAFTWTGEGSPTLIERRKNIEAYRASPRRPRTRESLMSIFTRDHAESYDPAVAEAVIRQELPLGDSVPSGSYLDMSTRLPLVDPAKLLAPVLIAHGQYDGIATEEDLLAFYAKLPNPTRQFVNIGGAAHGIGLGKQRHELWRAVAGFLPPATTASL